MKKFILLLTALILSIANLNALNLQDLIYRSRQMIGDTPYYSAIPKLSDQRIIDYINEGQRYAVANGWYLTKSITFSLLGGTTEYALPPDYQAVRRVLFKHKVMDEVTLENLDYNKGAWLDTQGSPSVYYTRTTTYSTVGFYPAPTISSTGTIILDYIPVVADLVNMTDIPFNGLPEISSLHESLAKFVAYRFYVTIGNTQLADIYAKEFVTDFTRIKAIIETKPNYRPGASAITGRND